MRRVLLTTVFALTVPLAACSGVGEALHGPSLTPMASSAMLAQDQAVADMASVREATPRPASANSLWRSGSRAFFIDQRAARVGDILTVLIQINDSAVTSNGTVASRTGANTAGVTNFFGLEALAGKLLPNAFSPANAINTNSTLGSTGTGSVNRSEQIALTIAAVVTQVLPNGNLVIQGRQEVKTNNDVRELTVAGIVRPADITAANTILHTQIAEARINYGGRGDISAVQKTPGGTALLQRYSPF
jgi:flagellar L-ring protein precursor FlgH